MKKKIFKRNYYFIVFTITLLFFVFNNRSFIKTIAQELDTEIKVLDAGDSRLIYSGISDNTWDYITPDVVSTCTDGDTVSYTGIFTQIEWWGEASENISGAIIYIDGEMMIKRWSIRDITERNTSTMLYTSDILERKEHTIKIELDNNGSGWISVDKFVVYDDKNTYVSEILDDADNQITYENFSAFNVGNSYFNSTIHSSNLAGATAKLTVENVRKIVLYSDYSFTRGRVEVYIDKEKITTLNLYDGLANDYKSYPVWISSDLSYDKHEIMLKVCGTKDIMATDCWVGLDAIKLLKNPQEQNPEDPEDIVYEYDDSSFGYVGNGWSKFTNLGNLYYMGTAHSTNKKGDFFIASFNDATEISVWGTKASNRGKANVYLDGVFYSEIDMYSSTQTSSMPLIEIKDLDSGIHTIKVENIYETRGTDYWLEIDKISAKGLNKENMYISCENNSFVSVYKDISFDQEKSCYTLKKGEKININVKGSNLGLDLSGGQKLKYSIKVDDKSEQYDQENSRIVQRITELEKDKFHKVEIECLEDCLYFYGLYTDDDKLCSLDSDMYSRAVEEIDERKNGTRIVSDPATWEPVDLKQNIPYGCVDITGGLFGEMLNRNQTYLNNSLIYTNGVTSKQDFWVDILGGSNEGRLLQGLSNTLLWGEYNKKYEDKIVALLETIRQRQITNGGNALPYDESALAGYNDGAYDERRNYDRAMFTKGLIAAGRYYEYKGVKTEDNLAYTILREFYDWYNYNENKYGESMLEGFLGLQGHIAGTMTYFTPVGTVNDMKYSELCYVQNWWMEYLSQGIEEAVWKYPLNRPHCYLTVAIDAYLDHYRATGDDRYLNACLGYWNILKNSFIHTGGSMAICEHQTYESKSYYTEEYNHTGELCGSVFWIDFNYKLLQLFPNEEKYANEIERSIINCVAAAQDTDGKIRYHQNLNGFKGNPEQINSCCEVTSIGMISRLNSFIYQVYDGGVSISLYNDSLLDYTSNGNNYKVKIEGDVTSSNEIVISNLGDKTKLRLRIPQWVSSPKMYINGELYTGKITNGEYLEVSVEKNDVIKLELVKEITAVKYIGYSQVNGYDRYSILYGPQLMAISPKGTTTVYSEGEEGILLSDSSIENFIESILLDKKTAGINGQFVFVPYNTIQNELFSTVPLFNKEETIITPKLPEYTTKNIDYIDEDSYEVIASENRYGFIFDNDEILSCPVEEQKAIIKNLLIDSGFDFKFTISAQQIGGIINGGIYVGINGNVGNIRDAISAYEVNIERNIDSNTGCLKIFAFDYNEGNGKYLGCIASQDVKIVDDSVTIRLLYKDEILYVFCEDDTPLIVFKQNLDNTGVGLRSYNSGIKFSNVSLLGASSEPIIDNQKIASNVINLINTLPNTLDIKVSDEQSIKNVNNKYNELTQEQKNLVDNYEDLKEKTDRLNYLLSCKEKAKNLIEKINEMNESEQKYSIKQIDELMNEYNALSSDEKEFVSNIDILIDANESAKKVEKNRRKNTAIVIASICSSVAAISLLSAFLVIKRRKIKA